jgi:hypothetical protein
MITLLLHLLRLLPFLFGGHRYLALGVDHAKRFPDLVAAVAGLPDKTLVLDGEVAVFDRQLRSRFEWLREPTPTPSLPRLC